MFFWFFDPCTLWLSSFGSEFSMEIRAAVSTHLRGLDYLVATGPRVDPHTSDHRMWPLVIADALTNIVSLHIIDTFFYTTAVQNCKK